MTIKSPADPQAIQMARAALNPIPLSSLNIMPRMNRVTPLSISPSLLTDSESSLDPLDYSSEDSTQNGGKMKSIYSISLFNFIKKNENLAFEDLTTAANVVFLKKVIVVKQLHLRYCLLLNTRELISAGNFRTG